MLCSFSCSSDLNYDQVNKFNAKPVVVANLAYFHADAPDFVVNGNEVPLPPYTGPVGFFDNSFVNQNLIKAELNFRVKNTINRSFTIYITLKENDGTVVENIPISVEASVDGSEKLGYSDPSPFVFPESQIDLLKRTTQMTFEVNMDPGTPLTENSRGRIELSSSITAYFDVK
ncbi:hypothetical protein EM308_17470 [Flavobacterium gilvum]|uniref:Uncharacterized protein n=2 Tax=Flavobacterium gilvum TaxID=1492737 RepID=A0AAC9N6E4_9FLAO|nr:hypothetical protein EM308_17470 [Flavobacterium gilvum]KFC61057.1 hypothetical protein FEM08_01790 [Flavobacterium gilvum]